MRQVAAALLLLIAGAVISAPAPLPHKQDHCQEPTYPTPSRYLIAWGTSPEKEGELTCYNTGWYLYYGRKYFFIWEYDPFNRIFYMWEASELFGGQDKVSRRAKNEMYPYRFPFTEKEFRTSVNYQGTKLSLKRIKK